MGLVLLQCLRFIAFAHSLAVALTLTHILEHLATRATLIHISSHLSFLFLACWCEISAIALNNADRKCSQACHSPSIFFFFYSSDGKTVRAFFFFFMLLLSARIFMTILPQCTGIAYIFRIASGFFFFCVASGYCVTLAFCLSHALACRSYNLQRLRCCHSFALLFWIPLGVVSRCWRDYICAIYASYDLPPGSSDRSPFAPANGRTHCVNGTRSTYFFSVCLLDRFSFFFFLLSAFWADLDSL